MYENIMFPLDIKIYLQVSLSLF